MTTELTTLDAYLETTEEPDSGALFSDDNLYRYRLWRVEKSGSGTVAFLMLNPSTADVVNDDPTITRCRGFARDWGYKRLEIINLFAWRSPHPKDLAKAYRPIKQGDLEGSVWDPVGPNNNQHILSVATAADIVIAAWGANGDKHGRNTEVLEMLWNYRLDKKVHYLALTKHKHPRHPLYLKKNLQPKQLPISF